jgi:hypothetical protein
MSSTHYFSQVLLKLEIHRQIFEKYSNIKFLEYLCSGRPSCSMRTDRQADVQTDMTKLVVACCNFSNSSNDKSTVERM